MPQTAYRHAVVALTEVTEFRAARPARRRGVRVRCTSRPARALAIPQAGTACFAGCARHRAHAQPRRAGMRRCRPGRRGVPVRVHGEHGRDVGTTSTAQPSRKHQRCAGSTSRLCTTTWPCRGSGRLPADKVSACRETASRRSTTASTRQRFQPRHAGAQPDPGLPVRSGRHWLVGTVGRMQTGQGPADAGPGLCAARWSWPPRCAIGCAWSWWATGPLRAQCQAVLRRAAWPTWPGCPASAQRRAGCHARPELLRAAVLAEGISNTILEAMASGHCR
jgi:hypothetical protein